jgi:hypothetical protein
MGEVERRIPRPAFDRWLLPLRAAASSRGNHSFGLGEKRESQNSLSTRTSEETILGTAVPALLTSGSVWKSRPPECLGGDGQSGIDRSSADIHRACSERAGSLDPPIQIRDLVPRWARGANSLIQAPQHGFSFPVNVPRENHRHTQKEIRIRNKTSDVRRFDIRLVGAIGSVFAAFSPKSTLLMSCLATPTSRENPKKLGGR